MNDAGNCSWSNISKTVDIPPIGAEEFAKCKPIYEEHPGWQSNTVGATKYEDLPKKAVDYLNRLSEVTGVPIDIISTGPDRAETIVLKNPFSS